MNSVPQVTINSHHVWMGARTWASRMGLHDQALSAPDLVARVRRVLEAAGATPIATVLASGLCYADSAVNAQICAAWTAGIAAWPIKYGAEYSAESGESRLWTNVAHAPTDEYPAALASRWTEGADDVLFHWDVSDPATLSVDVHDVRGLMLQMKIPVASFGERTKAWFEASATRDLDESVYMYPDVPHVGKPLRRLLEESAPETSSGREAKALVVGLIESLAAGDTRRSLTANATRQAPTLTEALTHEDVRVEKLLERDEATQWLRTAVALVESARQMARNTASRGDESWVSAARWWAARLRREWQITS